MKLKTIEIVQGARPSGAGQNEKSKDRTARMKAFWSDDKNAVLYPVGQLLAQKSEGKTLAELLVAGAEFELDSITSSGVTLPLQAGFTLSLKTLSVWGCPACRSAHGSGTYPSRELRADHLAGNKFFYNPATRALFVISNACYGSYVKALGANTAKRFVSPVPVTVKK